MSNNAKAINAGDAFVRLVAKDETGKGLKGVEKKLKHWGDSIIAVGSKVFAAGMLIDGAFDAAVLHFAEAGTEMTKMSAQTGISVENLSTLGFAADQSGISMEDLAVGMKHMQKTLGEAASGSKEAQKHLARLGLTVNDLAAMSPDEQFTAIAEAMSKIGNPTQRAAMAMEIFGRHGVALLPLLNQGANGIREMQQVARDWGLEMSTKDASAAMDLGKSLRMLTAMFKMLVFQIGSAAAPAFKKVRDFIAPIVRDTITWVRENNGLVVSITKIGLAIAGLGVAIIAVGVAFKIAALGVAIFGVAMAIVKALIMPETLILSAFVIGLIAAGGAAIKFGNAFQGVGETIKSAWGGIADAVKAGDLTLAGEIAVAGLKVVWIGFKQWFTEIWDRMVYNVATAMNIIGAKWDKMLEVMKAGWIGVQVGMHLMSTEEGERQLNENAARRAKNQMIRRAAQTGLQQSFAKKQQGRIDEMNAAEAELEALKNKASDELNKSRNPNASVPPGGLPPPMLFQMAESAGSFSAAAAGGMGLGSSITQSLQATADATKETAENTAAIAASIGMIGILS